MISPPLSTLATGLHNAAARRAYEEVQGLVVALCAAAAAEARSLPEGDARIGEIAWWLREQVEWTEVMLRTARAAQAEELRRIPFLNGYLRRQAAAISYTFLDV